MPTNLEVVKQFCRYYENGEKESYLKLCADNIVWESPRADGGACRGKKQMFDEYLPQFYSQFKEFSSVHEEFLDAGENVVALGRYKITSKSGEKFESPFAQIYTVRNGKIVQFRQYADSASIQQARAPSLHDSAFSKFPSSFIQCVCGHNYAVELKEDTVEVACPKCGRKMRIGKLVQGRPVQTDRLAGVDPSSLYPIITDHWKCAAGIGNETEASKLAKYTVKFPSRLPQDYILQLGVVETTPDGGKHVLLYFSKGPITDSMRLNEFFAQKGITVYYRKENTDPKRQGGFEYQLPDYIRVLKKDGVDASEVVINGNRALTANERDRLLDGCKLHDPSQVEFVKDEIHITLQGYFAKEELISVAESIK